MPERSDPPGGDGTRRWAWTARLVSPLVLLLLWQAASDTGLLSPRSLAAPTRIAATALDLALGGDLGRGMAVSSLRVVAGFAIALVLGIALAVPSGLSRTAEAVVDPPLQMLKALPFIGLMPLFILWFGIGEIPKILLVAFGSIFPIYLTLQAGIKGVDPRLIEAGRTLGLTRLELIRHIILPGALPSLLVGIRYGLGIAWLSLVVGEQVNAGSGIGLLIGTARDFLQTDVIVVCLMVYAGMGLATDAIVRAIEARALVWRPSIRGAT